ncbi:hypothetical protein SESBI_00974 [Sesbania bispinosa]|nr:hypothetical protein SESBI_00974 [Sesbania bispinosa]
MEWQLVWVKEADDCLELLPSKVAVFGIGVAELKDGVPVEVVAVAEAARGSAENIGYRKDLVHLGCDIRVGSWNPIGELAANSEVTAQKRGGAWTEERR